MTKNEMGRRDFLKKFGAAGVVVSGASLSGCSSGNKSNVNLSVEGTGGAYRPNALPHQSFDRQ